MNACWKELEKKCCVLTNRAFLFPVVLTSINCCCIGRGEKYHTIPEKTKAELNPKYCDFALQQSLCRPSFLLASERSNLENSWEVVSSGHESQEF